MSAAEIKDLEVIQDRPDSAFPWIPLVQAAKPCIDPNYIHHGLELVSQTEGRISVACACGIRGPLADTGEMAVELWNKLPRSGFFKFSEVLPPRDTYVLVHYTGGNWHSSDPNQGHNWKVAVIASHDSRYDPNNRHGWVMDTFGPGSHGPDSLDVWCFLPTGYTQFNIE